MSRLLAIVVAATFVFATSSSAEARIVPKKSIAGIRIGVKRAKVIERLGQPSSIDTCPGCGAGPGVRNGKLLRYKHKKIEVLLIRRRVAEISTTSWHQRTAAGIGRGSKRARVEAKYGQCHGGGSYQCFLGKTPENDGDRYTGVLFNQHNRVVRVAVGRFDADADEFCYLFGCG